MIQFNKIFIQLENQGIVHHYLQSTPEMPRSRDASSLPVRQWEITDQGPWAEDAYLEAGLDECPVCHVKRPNSCDFWVDHPIVPKK